MIRKLTGSVSHQGDNFIVLDVSGVGYMVYVSEDTIIKSQKETKLSIWTHLAVREKSMDLYGFLEKVELDFFEMLINVSGVGPKSALAILNLAPVESIMQAIASGDTAYLTKVSGIGKKSAAKIIIELREKIEKITKTPDSKTIQEEIDVLDALGALGYSATQARSVLREVSDMKTKKPLTTNQKIKEALRLLAQ